jgi:hypothetical protein
MIRQKSGVASDLWPARRRAAQDEDDHFSLGENRNVAEKKSEAASARGELTSCERRKAFLSNDDVRHG